MSVPKIIHYCWFGPKEIPALELHCMLSWEKYFPDYEVMFWNEETFDINSNRFAQQAYQGGHYAFVSDYVRTKVLYEYGGIYLDTDVEIIHYFDNVIKDGFSFLGFENSTHIGSAVMGMSKKHPIMGEFMNYYLNNSFINNSGDIDTIANVIKFTDILTTQGLNTNGKRQVVKDIDIYPRDYFYPKNISNNEFIVTNNTLSIHKYSCSWMTPREFKRGNNKIWINVIRPLLRFLREQGITLIGAGRIQTIEIKLRNLLK